MTDPIQSLHDLGQSLWYDNISRELLDNGALRGMIERGEVRGVTSNPSIFQQAISGASAYESALRELSQQGMGPLAIYERLAIEDIQQAADLFRSLYDDTGGGDGYVSLEVNPHLAHDTDSTVQEAQRLWDTVNRPNLMIKIPATPEGLPAIRTSIANGININVTLIFSIHRYGQVMAAYYAGLEDRLESENPIDRIASVASFFVSRVDTKVDQKLQEIIRAEGPQATPAYALVGHIAVANAKMAYAQFLASVQGERFRRLAAQGAQLQRPLWASTSTKNPDYSDIKYVEELIGPHTINTVPHKTLEAFKDHGQARAELGEGLEHAYQALLGLHEVGLSLSEATQELEDEGVQAFADSFDGLIDAIRGSLERKN